MFEDALDHELEADIFSHCYNVGRMDPTLMPDRSLKRPCPEHRLRQMSAGHPAQRQMGAGLGMYGNPMHQPPDTLRLMSRVILQQEETIARLRQEKCFVLFMKNEQEGIVQALLQVSREWNKKKEEGGAVLRSPLRTLLMQSMLQELQNRMQKEVATEEGKAVLLKRGWLTSENSWVYLKWDRQAKQLIQDPDRPALQHAEAIRLLTWVMKALQGDIIQRFGSSGLHKSETALKAVSTFHLEVAMRGPTALEMYEAFSTLTANSAMHLIGVSLKKDRMPQSALAKQLATITYRRR